MRAQEADSVAVKPQLILSDSLETMGPQPEGEPADTSALRVSLSAYTVPPGVRFGPVPATQPGLSIRPLLEALPGTFTYDLGSIGWPHGVSFAGQAPRRAALTLDGVPLTDLVTGRPRYDWLPLDLLGRLYREPTALGATTTTHAALRPLDAPVARTELRYLTGQEGVQFISATHAQTRRPGFVGREGRLGVLFHVSGQRADGLYTGSDLSGSRVLGRATLHRPGWALAVTEHRARLRSGARGSISGLLYEPLTATVADANADRTDVLHVLSARLRVQTPFFAVPFSATAFRVAQTARFGRAGFGSDAVSAEVEARRLGMALAQPFMLRGHALAVRLTTWRDAALDSAAVALVPETAARTFAHLALTDSTTLWGASARLGISLDATPEGTFASGHAEVTRRIGALHVDAALRHGGASYGRAEVGGYAPDSTDATALRVDAADALGDERTTHATLATRLDLGAFRFGVRATGVLQRDTRLLLADEDGDSATFGTLPGSLQRVFATATLAFRPEAARGVYAHVEATAQQGRYAGDGDPAQADRAIGVLPDAWGTAQLGVRALGVFDGVLDLDIALRGRAWTGFASRTFHASTALFTLPEAATIDAPAGGTLGVAILTRLQKRASLYVTYDNALASRA
ncbi:MAG: hypothetical protein AAF809_06970, partial [Bacteroidota bacterium]